MTDVSSIKPQTRVRFLFSKVKSSRVSADRAIVGFCFGPQMFVAATAAADCLIKSRETGKWGARQVEATVVESSAANDSEQSSCRVTRAMFN